MVHKILKMCTSVILCVIFEVRDDLRMQYLEALKRSNEKKWFDVGSYNDFPCMFCTGRSELLVPQILNKTELGHMLDVMHKSC